MVIHMHDIEPWPARAMIKGNLARQAELCRRTPLRKIPVEQGMMWFKDKVGGWFGSLNRKMFVEQATALLIQTGTPHSAYDRNELYDVFDSMDFDGNGDLSIGEWAGGLTVFFKGSQEQCVHAVFDTLDRNGDRELSKSELQEYFKPFVKAMSPQEAAGLRPLLLQKATDKIFMDMDFHHTSKISSDEMIEWSKNGRNIVDEIAQIIEHEVYHIWLEEKDREQRMNYSRGIGSHRGNAPTPPSYGGSPPPGYGGGPPPGYASGPPPEYGRGYGGPPPEYGGGYGGDRFQYGAGYGPNSSGPTYYGGGGHRGGGYGGNDYGGPGDYRDLPVPPGAQLGPAGGGLRGAPPYRSPPPRGNSWATDHHNESVYGGGW